MQDSLSQEISELEEAKKGKSEFVQGVIQKKIDRLKEQQKSDSSGKGSSIGDFGYGFDDLDDYDDYDDFVDPYADSPIAKYSGGSVGGMIGGGGVLLGQKRSGKTFAAKSIEPIVLSIQNTSMEDLEACLFGYNENFGCANFGNPPGIEITTLQGGTYGRIISDTNNQALKVAKWRFQSPNSTQLLQVITTTTNDANGRIYTVPLILGDRFNPTQFQSDMVDLNQSITIDGNTSLKFPILAQTLLVITIFPRGQQYGVTGKAKLGGKPVMIGMAQPSFGKVVSNVKQSTECNAKEAIATIKEMDSIDDINNFVSDEEYRKTVISCQLNRIEELSKDKDDWFGGDDDDSDDDDWFNQLVQPKKNALQSDTDSSKEKDTFLSYMEEDQGYTKDEVDELDKFMTDKFGADWKQQSVKHDSRWERFKKWWFRVFKGYQDSEYERYKKRKIAYKGQKGFDRQRIRKQKRETRYEARKKRRESRAKLRNVETKGTLNPVTGVATITPKKKPTKLSPKMKKMLIMGAVGIVAGVAVYAILKNRKKR